MNAAARITTAPVVDLPRAEPSLTKVLVGFSWKAHERALKRRSTVMIEVSGSDQIKSVFHAEMGVRASVAKRYRDDILMRRLRGEVIPEIIENPVMEWYLPENGKGRF